MEERSMTRAAQFAAFCAGAVTFERALLVSIADRVARAPSLPAKIVLCRWLWHAACRIRSLGRLLPADMVASAFTSHAHARVESFALALRNIETQHEFLISIRDAVV